MLPKLGISYHTLSSALLGFGDHGIMVLCRVSPVVPGKPSWADTSRAFGLKAWLESECTQGIIAAENSYSEPKPLNSFVRPHLNFKWSFRKKEMALTWYNCESRPWSKHKLSCPHTAKAYCNNSFFPQVFKSVVKQEMKSQILVLIIHGCKSMKGSRGTFTSKTGKGRKLIE